TLIEGDVLPYLGRFADDDPHAVVDKTAGPDLGAGMDFNPRQKPVDVGDDARDQQQAVPPQPVRHAVHQKGGKPGIHQDDFQPVAGRRVLGQRRLHVAPDLLPQAQANPSQKEKSPRLALCAETGVVPRFHSAWKTGSHRARLPALGALTGAPGLSPTFRSQPPPRTGRDFGGQLRGAIRAAADPGRGQPAAGPSGERPRSATGSPSSLLQGVALFLGHYTIGPTGVKGRPNCGTYSMQQGKTFLHVEGCVG